MSTYEQHLSSAHKCNLVKRVVERETNGTFKKVETALTTQRLYCVMRLDKSSNVQHLNNDNRKCPSLYEAEAIDFSKSLYRTRDMVKRCVICTRALHPLLDIKKTKCSFCLK